MAPRKVLIIEDDTDIRKSLGEILELEGYQVIPAIHGQEALDLLADHVQPDVILLDLNMPVMGGVEFRKHQLARDDYSKIPVVLLSAGNETVTRAEELNVQAHLKKPMAIDALLDTIEGLFQ